MLCQKRCIFRNPTEPLFLAKPWAQILTKRHLRNQADIFLPNISSEPDHIHTARRPTKAEMNECTYCTYLPTYLSHNWPHSMIEQQRIRRRRTRSCERHSANSFVPRLSLITERFVNCWCHFGICERMVYFIYIIYIYLKPCDGSVISQYCKSIIKAYLETYTKFSYQAACQAPQAHPRNSKSWRSPMFGGEKTTLTETTSFLDGTIISIISVHY